MIGQTLSRYRIEAQLRLLDAAAEQPLFLQIATGLVLAIEALPLPHPVVPGGWRTRPEPRARARPRLAGDSPSRPDGKRGDGGEAAVAAADLNRRGGSICRPDDRLERRFRVGKRDESFTEIVQGAARVLEALGQGVEDAVERVAAGQAVVAGGAEIRATEFLVVRQPGGAHPLGLGEGGGGVRQGGRAGAGGDR